MPPREEGAPENWQPYDTILPSQLTTGSKVKVACTNGARYLFATTPDEEGFVTMLEASDPREVGQRGALAGGGFKIGEGVCLHIVGTTFPVTEISAIEIAPDTVTPEAERVYEKYFHDINPSVILAQISLKITEAIDLLVEAGEMGRTPNAPMNVVDHTDLHTKISAATMEFAKRVRDEGRYTPKEMEEIWRAFSPFIRDHALWDDASQNVVFDVTRIDEQGQHNYEVQISFGIAHEKVGHFNLNKWEAN